MPDPIFAVTPPDKEIYERIGMVASEWSWVESLLGEFLSNLCRADPGAMYVITQSVSTATITDWLKTLIQIKFEDDNSRKVVLDLLNEIDTTRGERNTVVHGLWRGHGTPGFAWVRTARWDRSEVVKEELWSNADLDDLVVDIQQKALDLGKIGVQLGFCKIKTPAPGSATT